MNSSPNPAVSELPPSLRERWPQILRYPLQPEALSTIVVLAVAYGAAQLLPGLLAGVLDLFVWAAFFRYGFEVLRWSANGRDKAPEISLTVSDAIGGYAVLLLLLVEGAIALTAAWYSLIAAVIIGLLATFAMPAMMMILALEEGVARAMLQQIKLTLPNDPVIPQVDAYLAFLDKLAATPVKSTTPPAAP